VTAGRPGDSLHVHASGRERGRESEQHRRRQARQQEKSEDPPVERDFVRAWNPGGPEHHQQPGTPSRDGDANQTPGEREQQALDQELTDQAQTVRAERGAGRHLTDADGHPRQEKVRDVGARGRQDQTDGGKQHPERAPHRPQHVVGERHQPDADARPGRGLRFEPRGDHAQFGGRGLDRDAGLQPRRDVAAPQAQLSRRRPKRRERNPHVGP
jgi:hypothetical protein